MGDGPQIINREVGVVLASIPVPETRVIFRQTLCCFIVTERGRLGWVEQDYLILLSETERHSSSGQIL